MSEARNQRFEIDIDEIERQLRRSVEAAPASRPDPLAELARIVGQDDPFRGILGNAREPAASNVHRFDRPAPPPVVAADPGYDDQYVPSNELFDPVTDAYGSLDGALDSEDIQPLRPRRGRGRLAAVMAALLLTVAAVSGVLYWKKAGTSFLAGGAPPVITADRSPLKVAPENPGGVEVPNQNRQIYEKPAPDGQSRVVDGREQPIDVREAARTMPQPPAVSARTPVPSSEASDPPRPSADAAVVAAPVAGRNVVTSALGEPHRVRTVAVRPDGTTYVPGASATTASLGDPVPAMVPSSLPPPTPVAVVTVSGRTAAATPPPVQGVPAAVSTDAAPTGTPVRVLPPARPKFDRRADDDEAPAPVRTALATPADRPARTATVATTAPADRPAPATAGRKFTVQIAVRPTDEEARTAYAQLQDRYAAELDGRPAQVTRAEVNGKTVHRVRIGPLSKDEADGLCGRLKTSGGSCFVASN